MDGATHLTRSSGEDESRLGSSRVHLDFLQRGRSEEEARGPLTRTSDRENFDFGRGAQTRTPVADSSREPMLELGEIGRLEIR